MGATPEEREAAIRVAILNKENANVLKLARILADASQSIPLEDMFFILDHIRRHDWDDNQRKQLNHFLVTYKLQNSDIISEAKNALAESVRRTIAREKHRREEAEREAADYRNMTLMLSAEGGLDRTEVLKFINKFRANPVQAEVQLDHDDHKWATRLRNVFGKDIELITKGWFKPRWSFRKVETADRIVRDLEMIPREAIQDYLKTGDVDSAIRRLSLPARYHGHHTNF